VALFEKAQASGMMPRLYQSCGTKDFLFQMNQKINATLTEKGAQIDYWEVPDFEHEWDFWDMEIKNVMKWMLQE
jgi:S-formylglutathione hydrolase FrmB